VTNLQAIITPQLMIALLVLWSLIAIPSAVILKRLGHSPAWVLLLYVAPPLALLGLWLLAFVPGSKSNA